MPDFIRLPDPGAPLTIGNKINPDWHRILQIFTDSHNQSVADAATNLTATNTAIADSTAAAAAADATQASQIAALQAAVTALQGHTGSATYDPPNITGGSSALTTVAVTGAVLGMYAEAAFSLDLQGMTVTAYVSAADVVSVEFFNPTAGPLNLASGTLTARARA